MTGTLPERLLAGSACVWLLALVAASTSACGSEPSSGELREWRPSDHQLPEGMDESSPDPTMAADPGAALYGAHCASCHGRSGRGDGPGAPPMARVPSFADPAIQARTDEELTEVIVAGRGGFMPAFGDRLAGPGIAAIVHHLRSFAE